VSEAVAKSELMETLNGSIHASVTLPEAWEPDDALAASQRHLDAALRQIGALQRRDSLLRQEMARLGEAVEKARKFAYHDELTGLPNRRLLLDRFNQAVARGARQDKRVALLFLDLDGFKRINDALGHIAGDQVLQQVAARLAACIRTADTACRYGGDEFIVLLPELEGPEHAVAAAAKIRAHLGALPYVVDGAQIKLTASIGMAVYPIDGRAYRDLMRASDRAMYRDKGRDVAPQHVRELETRSRSTAPIRDELSVGTGTRS
jgi:diguanylate cyclase (GGDEF)-like protein